MDSEAEDFLRIIGDIIRTNGAKYQDQKQFKFIQGKGGQLSIRYSPLLNQYPSLRIYLRQKFNGIRGVYQIRVNNQVDEQSVLYRNITCACAACIQSNYDACLTDNTWTHKSLNNDAAQERRQAAINHREANLDLAALENEEQQANAFAVGDMNATWARKGQRAIELSKKRGNTTAKRDLARLQQQNAISKRPRK